MKYLIIVMGVLYALLGSGPAAAADPLIFMPFAKGDTWICTQGPSGVGAGNAPSHVGSLSYAYDFSKYGAFGKPIYSPVAGTVVDVTKWVPDNTNNAGSNAQNNGGWGNQVIIKDSSSGKFVRINHMQQNSAAVSVGQTVVVSSYLGKVGKTGFSSGPHLHIQVQDTQSGASVPFKFVEGPVNCSNHSSLTSVNLWNASVLDNDAATNLGHSFGGSQVSVLGNWSSSTSIPGFTGADYFHHAVVNNDTAALKWVFLVKSAKFYTISVNWTPAGNRDSNVRYTLVGPVIGTQTAYRNQTVGGKLNAVFSSVFLSPGNIYWMTVQGTTPGTVAVADAMVVQ